MRGAFVIAGKDLRGLFLSPLFYILTGICSITWSLLFYFSVSEFVAQSMMSRLQSQGQGAEGFNLHFTVFAKHMSLVNLVMVFSVAAMTMRMFTEEKRQRTFDLLLTSPVTATEIVLGKLIAGILTAWALLAVSFLYPLSLRLYGPLQWGPLLSAYVGLMLVAATYVAIGMFASSLTESAVLAVIMALIFNVMLWFLGAAADATGGQTWHDIFEHLNIGSHFINFLKGNPSLAGVVYFASAVFLFTFLTQRVVESARWR